MNEFIKIILSLSVSGTLLLFFILGLKLLYKNKCSRRWQYYIWIIVVLRFLLPFTFDRMNVGNLFQMFHTTVITKESPARSGIPVTINTNDNQTKQTQADEDVTAAFVTHNSRNLSIYLFFVWFALILVLFVRKATIYQGFIRYIKAGSTEVSDVKTLNLLSDCEEKLNIKTRVELYQNVLITSPMMIGFFHPSIVLPAAGLEERELFYIFVHELFHYKRRDMFYKWLIQIVVCIHWFNPFVYLLEREVNKACELSCDEAVLSILDDNARREYGDILISFSKSNNLYKGSLTFVTLTEGAKQLKERLGAIMNFKKKTKAIQILTGVLTLCIVFGAAFVGVDSVAVATGSNSTGTSKSPMQEEKNHGTGTYVYDENLDAGWYGSDETLDNSWNWGWEDKNWDNKDWNDDWDWGWDNEDWDDDWDWDDKALIEAYAAYGIEKNGKSYYYKGELVNIIKDQRPDSSFYMLDINSKGTASIKVIRNTEGEITGVSYMTEEEVVELLERATTEEEIPAINTKEWNSSAILTIEAYYKTDNIYILPSPTNKVILKEYLTEDKLDYYASTEIKNNILTIYSGDRPATNYQSYIEIYIPEAVLDNVKVETVSGAITIDNYIGMLTLSTTSGSIDIFDSNIAGNVNTVSGRIGLSPSDILGNLYVNSHSGKIEAVFPNSVSYNLKAKTVTGKMKGSHFHIQSKNEKEFSGIVGSNPKFTITLKTFSANIEVD